MKSKKIVATIVVFAMMMGLISSSFAEPTEDFHVEESTDETQNAKGPVVEEYAVYVDDSKKVEPGSQSGDVNLNTVGKGLYFDGNDFYFFLDTGVMATNFMYNIEGDRFFFGEDGKMVKDQIVSYNGEIYYFDVNGAMYKNRWYSQEEIDVYENTITYTDYYFGPTGRAYRAGDSSNGLVIKTIEGEKFGFNTDCEKVEGYYDSSGNKLDPSEEAAYADCIYYFDPENNGAAVTGWHYYEGSERGSGYDDNEELVMYFDEKTCKKVAAKASSGDDRCISRIIEGQRYMFDSNGIRRNKWYRTEPGRATYSNAKFFSSEYDGYLQKGWFQAVPGSYENWETELILDVNKERHKNDEEVWFYAGSNGNILRKTIRKIGNYVYAFDDDGVMQQDVLVKVRNGAFIKAYETQYLYRANVIYDYTEYGGVPADSAIGTYGNPTNLTKTTGLLSASNKEQWMYFGGETGTGDKAGAQCNYNSPIKIELNDEDIYFICNSTGGYSLVDTTPDSSIEPNLYLTTLFNVATRNSKKIQNGVLLRPNGDDNNYGLIRKDIARSEFKPGVYINYKNKCMPSTGTTKYLFSYTIVNSSGVAITATNKSFKDKEGNWIYVGENAGEIIGVYPYQGKYGKATKNYYEDNDSTKAIIANKGSYCWLYKKDGDKEWTAGLPPEDSRIDPSYLYLNFSKESNLSKGPYTDGIASEMYKDTADGYTEWKS